MSPRDVKLDALREAAASQWDLITAAQCTRLGINGQDIYQFRHRGALTTVLRGVYLAHQSATEVPAHDSVTGARASWLALGADRWARERRTAAHPDAVIAHSTALSVHRIAEPLTGRPELVMGKRARKSHSGVMVIESTHQPVWDEITTIAGLPVQTVPTAIGGLINRPQGPPHLTYLAAALHTALTVGISRDELLDSVVDAAARHSYKHIDVRNLLVEFAVEAGLDREHASQALTSDRWNQRLSAERLRASVRALLEQLADVCLRNVPAGQAAAHLDVLTQDDPADRLDRCSVAGCDNQAWQTGLCPLHARAHRRLRVTTPDPTAPRSGFGLYGILDDDGETIACHECGRRMRQLTAGHLATHDMGVDDYRHAHGLPSAIGLIAGDTHATYASRAYRTGATERIRAAQPLSLLARIDDKR